MKRKIEVTIVLLGWFALISQFLLILTNRQAGILETILRFFSYFTILTNLLVALSFTGLVFHLKSNISVLLKKNTTVTALTVFILIVGLVYQFILRNLWQPTGLQYIVDELLHTIIPLLVLMYWIMNLAKEELPVKAILIWLIYPFTYLAFILIRGHFSEFYPYPFLNIPLIGKEKAFLHIGGILALALILMASLILISRILNRMRRQKI